MHAHQHFRDQGVPYNIVTIPDGVILTQVPSTWKELKTQRKRWQRVVLEVVWKYKRMIFNSHYGIAGMVTMPYLLFYEALGPFIEAFSYIFIVTLAILGLLNLTGVAVFLAFSFGLNAISRILAVLVDIIFFSHYSYSEAAKLILAALLEPIIYRPALLPARLLAFPEFLRGYKGHEKVTRVANKQA